MTLTIADYILIGLISLALAGLIFKIFFYAAYPFLPGKRRVRKIEGEEKDSSGDDSDKNSDTTSEEKESAEALFEEHEVSDSSEAEHFDFSSKEEQSLTESFSFETVYDKSLPQKPIEFAFASSEITADEEKADENNALPKSEDKLSEKPKEKKEPFSQKKTEEEPAHEIKAEPKAEIKKEIKGEPVAETAAKTETKTESEVKSDEPVTPVVPEEKAARSKVSSAALEELVKVAVLEAAADEITKDRVSKNPSPKMSLKDKNASEQQSFEKPELDADPPFKELEINLTTRELIDRYPALMIEYIKDASKDKTDRLYAVRKASELQSSDAVMPLIAMLYESDSDLSSAAAESLAEIGDERAIQPLEEISKITDRELLAPFDLPDTKAIATYEPLDYRSMVVFRIDSLSPDYFDKTGSLIPAKDFVLKGLGDENENLRAMAAKVAINVRSEEIAGPLEDILANSEESDAVRSLAAEALGEGAYTRSIPALAKALEDSNISVRYSAVNALGRYKGKDVTETLLSALTDTDKYVRSAALHSLGAYEDSTLIERFIKMLADEEEVVRFSAGNALSVFPKEEVSDTFWLMEFESSTQESMVRIELLTLFELEGGTEELKYYLNSSDSDVMHRASLALAREKGLDAAQDLLEASKRLDAELKELAKENELAQFLQEQHENQGVEGFNKV
ncbi:MAG: hypothetical protein GX221_01100 [Candidatus Riflebacteria bacterium]|nr:hypothetical protein [Candidatus Riflebacteria bacterium]